jgi:alpha-D-ribose 1-methylphosphonate 5-triphosphate synthase subunit PhnG
METNNLMVTLSKTDLQSLQEVVKQIAAVFQVKVMKPASTSLVMMGAKDSVQKVPFYLGEVLVTQCVVAVNDIIGYGFVMGDDSERAYYLAVIEGAIQSENSLTTMLDEFIARQTERIHSEKVRDYATIAQTRVRFESMQEA